MADKEKIKNYPMAIITILMGLIFILSIGIIGTFGTIKSKSRKMSYLNVLEQQKFFSNNYSAISAIFPLEVILFVEFIILFIILYIPQLYEGETLEKIMLFIFLICQLLYLINCVLIPVYLKEFKFIIKMYEDLNSSQLQKLKNLSGYYKGNIWALLYIFSYYLIIRLFTFKFISFYILQYG